MNVNIFISLFFLFLFSCSNEKTSNSNNNCSEKSVVKIAESKWLEVYGESINDRRPFIATLKDTIWKVRGTLPQGYDGGVPEATINAKTCEIIEVSHGK